MREGPPPRPRTPTRGPTPRLIGPRRDQAFRNAAALFREATPRSMSENQSRPATSDPERNTPSTAASRTSTLAIASTMRSQRPSAAGVAHALGGRASGSAARPPPPPPRTAPPGPCPAPPPPRPPAPPGPQPWRQPAPAAAPDRSPHWRPAWIWPRRGKNTAGGRFRWGGGG